LTEKTATTRPLHWYDNWLLLLSNTFPSLFCAHHTHCCQILQHCFLDLKSTPPFPLPLFLQTSKVRHSGKITDCPPINNLKPIISCSYFSEIISNLDLSKIAFNCSNGMSSIGYLGRFFETARTAW
jgi:hypothetical protein